MKKFDIYQYKAIVLLACCVVLVGTGACTVAAVLMDMDDQRKKAIERKEAKKSEQLFKEIKVKIDNNQATATDYFVFARMVYSRSFRYEIGMLEGLNEKEIHKIYAKYLQKAINKGSQEAKLDYANLLLEQNENITDKNLDDKEKKAKYLKLKQVLILTEEVVNKQCEVYKKPYYPNFYDYPKYKQSVISYSRILYWIDFDYPKIKFDYPELYQQAQKLEKTYEKICKKEKIND